MSLDVASVGHVLIDIRFLVDRFAGPDESVMIGSQSRGVGGSAANVAIDVRRMGGSSAVMGKVGFDEFGRQALEELTREGVDVAGVRISMSPTGFSVISIDSAGEIAMYEFPGAAEELSPDEVDARIIGRAKAVHIASLGIDASMAAASAAVDAGAIVSWDPGRVLSSRGLGELKGLVELADVVLLNARECAALTGEQDPRAGARRIASLGPSLVVVKMGGRGAYALSKGEGEVEVPAFRPPSVTDTTGAGDAFASGLLLSMVRGYDVRRSLAYASAAAALKVSRLGSHEVPSEEEVIKVAWGSMFTSAPSSTSTSTSASG